MILWYWIYKTKETNMCKTLLGLCELIYLFKCKLYKNNDLPSSNVDELIEIRYKWLKKYDFTAGRKATLNKAHGQISTGTGRDPVAKDTTGALEGVFGGETQSRTLQEPDNVEGRQH